MAETNDKKDECPYCKGKGGKKEISGTPTMPRFVWVECVGCNGTGEVENKDFLKSEI